MTVEILQYPTPPTTPDSIPRQPFAYPKAWVRGTLEREHVFYRLPAQCLDELDCVAQSLRRDPLPTLALRPEFFSLDACRALMAEVKRGLTDGPGCAVLDRLPMDRISRDEAVALYWLLGSMVAQPVAQKWNGLMVYDVRDVGNKHGIGVRGSTTSAELNFHTDNSYALVPPQFIGLLCLQTAIEGGESRLISWRSVYNRMLEQHPDLLERGFDRFLYDRNNEHLPGAPKAMSKPALAIRDSDIDVRLSMNAIADGYEMTGQAIDPDGRRFLEAVKEILADPAMRIDLDFEPGQIQLINNRVIGHARTGFKDDPAPDKKRHLVRLWFREAGRVSYDG